MAINNPRDIPGLVAWYSAEAETGYTSGQGVTQWTDLSGNGNHATQNAAGATDPKWEATTGPAGGASVRFSAAFDSTWFKMPANVMAAATAGEIFAKIKSDGTNGGLWALGPYDTNGNESHYPYGGVVYEAFGLASGYRQSFTPTLPLTSWRTYNIWSANGDWSALLDGTTQVSSTTAGVVAWAPNILIGAGGKNSGADLKFAGNISAIVLYNRKLTTTERADLNAWLDANPSGGTSGPIAPTVTLTGTAPAVTGALDLTVTGSSPALTLAGTAPTVTGALGGSVEVAPIAADLAGTAPKVTGALVLEQTGVGLVDLTGAAPAVSGSFDLTASGAAIEVHTDAVNRLNGMTLVTEWAVEVEPPVTEPKRQRAHDYAIAVSITEPTLVEGRPT